MSNTRIERDSMGELQVPEQALYGAQTQRAVDNFPISGQRMPRAFIRALILALGLQTLPAAADTTQAMRTALELAAGKDWDGALAVAPSGVGRDVIEWQRLRAGETV